MLRPGDLIQLAAVALTVIRPTAVNGATEPAASVPVPVAPPAPPIARPAATIAVRSTEPQRRVVPNGGLRALVALAGGLIALLAVSRPVRAGDGWSPPIWELSSGPLIALTAFALVGALAVGAVWPVFEFTARSDRDRALAALASTGAGGLLAGVACALLAWPSPGGRLAGAPGALLFAGLTLACAGVGRIHLLGGPRRGRRGSGLERAELLLGAAALASLVAALAAGARWADVPGRPLGGLDHQISIGRWLVPLGLAAAGACLIGALVGRRVEQRTGAPAAAAAVGATATVATLALAGGELTAGHPGVGALLATSAATVALTLAVGAALMQLARTAHDSPGGRATPRESARSSPLG